MRWRAKPHIEALTKRESGRFAGRYLALAAGKNGPPGHLPEAIPVLVCPVSNWKTYENNRELPESGDG